MALFLNPAVADAYESKTLAEMRGLVFGSLGFVDPLSFGPPRSLKMLRDALQQQLGFIGPFTSIQTPGPGGSTYPPARTLKNLRRSIINRMGYVDPLSITPRTLKQLRDAIKARLGLAIALLANVDTFDNIKTDVYVALGYSSQLVSPPGVDTLIQTWIEQAQSTLLARIEFDWGATARPTSFVSGQTSTIDATPIRLLAIAYGKAHDGSPDASGWMTQVEKYLADLMQRTPPAITAQINAALIEANQVIYRRFDLGLIGTNIAALPFGLALVTGGDYSLLTADTTIPQVDDSLVEMLALAMFKEKIGHPDAKTQMALYEQAFIDLAKRSPPNIIGMSNAMIIGAHRTVLRRFEMGNISDPSGPSMSDFGVDITASGIYTDTTCDDDECETDDNAVELLALAELKERYGQADAKAYAAQYEQYMVDQLKRSPPGFIQAANAALTSANETIFRRYVVGNFGVTDHSQNWLLGTSFTFNFDDDLPQVDDQAVYLLALANLEQKYGIASYKQSRADYERYMDDLFLRMPPNATPLVNSILKQVQQQLFRQYAIFRDKYWFTWTMKAGQRFYGAFDHDNARSLAPIKLTATLGAINATPDHSLYQRTQDHQVVLLPDGRVMALGGQDQFGTILNTNQVYDPTLGGWNPGVDMQMHRTYFTATLYRQTDNKPFVLLTGGWNGNVIGPGEIYDLATDTWIATTNFLAYPRREHTATLMKNGDILIAGGMKSNSVSTEEYQAEIFSPTTRSYTQPVTAAMVKRRQGHAATALPDGRVLITGGLVTGTFENASNTTELYDPAAKTFTAGPVMKQARRYHTSTLLPNGQVLIAGGWDEGSVPIQSAELFDPFNNKFNLTTSLMTVTRALHIAILMDNETVLLAGDASAANGATGEIYDPSTGKFNAAGNTMPVAVSQMQAVLMDDGRVMIPGGATPTSTTNAVTYFDPATNLFAGSGSMTQGNTYYHVTATTANGESEPGNEAFVLNVPAPPPPAPNIELDWTILPNQPYVTGFNIYRGKATGTGYLIGTVGPTVNTFTDNGDIAPGAPLPTQNDTAGPGALDVRKIEWIGISQDNVSWRPLVIGVPPTTYNNNQEGIPQFCEIRQAIELWPTPAMDGWKLRIKGSFAPFLFENDNDYTTLDWQAIWFFAVAAAKSTFKRLDGRPMFNQIDIATAGAQADEYLGNLIAGSHMGQRFIPGEPVRRNEIQPILLPGPNS